MRKYKITKNGLTDYSTQKPVSTIYVGKEKDVQIQEDYIYKDTWSLQEKKDLMEQKKDWIVPEFIWKEEWVRTGKRWNTVKKRSLEMVNSLNLVNMMIEEARRNVWKKSKKESEKETQNLTSQKNTLGFGVDTTKHLVNTEQWYNLEETLRPLSEFIGEDQELVNQEELPTNVDQMYIENRWENGGMDITEHLTSLSMTSMDGSDLMNYFDALIGTNTVFQ
ncbi:hypothetical protein [Circo-like virus-Brazil hs2]|nr:hypothetical protein [Circo-like virus-Brazil hs2]